MVESESKKENNQKERRFDPKLLKKGLRCDLDQYEMLKRCSDKKDMTEWNEWRKEHPDEDILLEGVNLSKRYLEGVNLSVDPLGKGSPIGPDGAVLSISTLKKRNYVHLEKAVFNDAKLEGANLTGAHLEEAKLHAKLEEAIMREAYLEGAVLNGANLQRAKLNKADLRNSEFQDADLRDTIFFCAKMQGAYVRTALVSGVTSFWEIEVDRNTIFLGTSLESVRIHPKAKQLLEYNIRRMNWEEWYPKQHRCLRWLVHNFWEISDYGISTKQIIKTFFKWAIIFAAIYLAWGLIDYHLLGLKDNPGIVSNLLVLEGEQEIVSPFLVPFRSIYFSIVTMTTLGFGDMYANAHYFIRGLFGHVLLALQVILGYVLLGALVTRFAVLFTAGGPAGKFADEKKERVPEDTEE